MSANESKELVLKFKMPLGAVMWLLLIGNLFGFALFSPFIFGILEHVSLLETCLVILGITLVADIFLGLICIACFKVKLNPRGISCSNFWGVYSFVLWDEMREIKIINLLGLKYARLFFRNSRIPLWVPLFINDRAGFSKTLSEFAPPSNLLRQAFDRD